MMHRANVLDVVRAVTQVATNHPQVSVWWYVPRLLDNPNIELLVKVEDEHPTDLDAIAREVDALLDGANVTVKRHADGDGERRLFRVLSHNQAAVDSAS